VYLFVSTLLGLHGVPCLALLPLTLRHFQAAGPRALALWLLPKYYITQILSTVTQINKSLHVELLRHGDNSITIWCFVFVSVNLGLWMVMTLSTLEFFIIYFAKWRPHFMPLKFLSEHILRWDERHFKIIFGSSQSSSHNLWNIKSWKRYRVE